MAEQSTVDLTSGAQVDYADHAKMYALFIGFTKYGTAAIVIVLILLAFFLI